MSEIGTIIINSDRKMQKGKNTSHNKYATTLYLSSRFLKIIFCNTTYRWRIVVLIYISRYLMEFSNSQDRLAK